jgi:hypothetical protein
MRTKEIRLRTFAVHVWLIGLLVVVHIVCRATPLLGLLPQLPLSSLFDLGEEQSIPNVFSAVALVGASGAALFAAQCTREADIRLRGGWYLIAALLLFLGVDEGAGIHDRLSLNLPGKLQLHGVFYIGWVLPYLFVLAGCSIALLRVAVVLPSNTRRRLFIAALIYVASAMGLEAFEALIFESASAGGPLQSVNQYAVNAQPLMIILVTIEEAGEMLAVALALRAILIYIEEDLGVVALSVDWAPVMPSSQVDVIRTASNPSTVSRANPTPVRLDTM